VLAITDLSNLVNGRAFEWAGKVSIRSLMQSSVADILVYSKKIALLAAIHADRTVNSEIRLIPFNLAAGGNCLRRGLCVSLHAKR
jgi:hypothetical protein